MAPPYENMRLEGVKERAYVLKEKLGGGSFASVWRALDQETHDSYAIKIFETGAKRSLETPEQAEEACAREVAVLIAIRDLRCPYLIRIDESFKDVASGLYCIVMNLVEGDSLKGRMLLPHGYTLSDVLRWTRQLAIAVVHLASIKRDAVVHGDIKPDNILVAAATGDLVLGDCGAAMWQGLKTGLRFSPWLLADCAYVAPERRLEYLGPDSMDLDDETKTMVIEQFIKKVGGGKLDVWSLGVVAYLLILRKDPSDYSHEQVAIRTAKMKEVDKLLTLKDAQVWLQTEALRVWPGGGVTEVEVLIKVILGTLQRLEGRMSAERVLELLEPIGDADGGEGTGESPAEMRERHKRQLAERLQSRPGLVTDHRVSLLTEDVVRLDLLPNSAFLETLTRKGQQATPGDSALQGSAAVAPSNPASRADGDDDGGGGLIVDPRTHQVSVEQGLQGEDGLEGAPVPVNISQLHSGEACGKGLSVIVGPPGAGKTTLLHCLALRLAQADGEGGEVPVIVHAQNLLEQLTSEGDDVKVLIGQVAAAVDGALISPGYKESLQNIAIQAHRDRSSKPMLTLLVDGLDEVAQAHRNRLLQRLLHLQASANPSFRRVFVCSRPGAFERLGMDHNSFEAVLRLLPLDQERSEQLVEGLMTQWAVKQPDLADQIKRLACTTFQGSPLLLYLLCCLAKEESSVPESSVDLFERMLQLYLRRAEARVEASGQAMQWDDKKLIDMCGLTAFLIHQLGWQGGSEVVMRRDLETALDTILRSDAGRPWAADVFGQYTLKTALNEALEGFSGLLCQQGRTSCRMLHRNLQEYLAARFLARQTGDSLLRAVQQYVCNATAWGFDWSSEAAITSDWWAEVYRFAGLMQGPTWLAERLLQPPQGAMQVDGAAAANQPTSAEQWLQGISDRGLDAEDIFLRRLRHVLRACCGAGPLPNAIDAESALLVACAITRVQICKPCLAGATIFHESFLSNQEWRSLCAEASAPLAEWLLDQLVTSDAQDRDMVRIVNCMIQNPASSSHALDALIRALSSGSSPVVMRALPYLTAVGSAAASAQGVVDALARLLLSEDGDVVKCVESVLVKMMKKESATNPGVANALAGLLSSPDTSLVTRTVGILPRIGRAAASIPGVMERLTQLLRRADLELVGQVVRALRRMDEAAVSKPGVLEGLVGLLHHTDSELVGQVLRALGDMGEAAASKPGVVEGVLELLHHTDHKLVQQAADTLGHMRQAAASKPGVVEGLVGLLHHTDSELVGQVLRALRQMGEAAASKPGVVEGVLELLHHTDHKMAQQAADTLHHMGEAAVSKPGVVEELVRLLHHTDPEVVGQAVRVLGYMAEAAASKPGVVEGLVGLLRHTDSEVVGQVLWALRHIGEAAASKPGVLEGVMALLHHADYKLVLKAARALRHMSEAAVSKPGVVEELVGLLCYPRPEVVKQARETLDHMGEASVGRLVKLLSQSDTTRVVLAARTLGRMGNTAASKPGVIDALKGLLSHSEADVVKQAAQVISLVHDPAVSRPDVTKALVDLLSHADTKVRDQATKTLHSMRDSPTHSTCVVEAVVGLLRRADTSDVMKRAVNVLGYMAQLSTHRCGVTEALMSLLTNEDTRLVKHAVRTLGQIDKVAISKPDVVQALVNLLSHNNTDVVLSAAEALSHIREGAVHGPEVMDAVSKLLCHKRKGVVGAALRTVAEMGKMVGCMPGVLEALAALLRDPPSDSSLKQTVQIVGQIGEAAADTPGVAKALVGLLAHPDVAEDALDALAKMGGNALSDPGVMEGLMDLLSHKHSTVVKRTLEVLGAMGDAAASKPDVVKALVNLLRCKKVTIVNRAAEILGFMGPAVASRADVVEELKQLLSHSNKDVVKRAAQVLGQMGEVAANRAGVIDALVNLLGHEDVHVTRRAVEALSNMGRAAARQDVLLWLVSSLTHADNTVVVWAAEALGNIAGNLVEATPSEQLVMDALVGLLSHEDVEVVKRTVNILGGMEASRPGVAKALVDLLRHEDILVVRRAAQCLARMGEAAATPHGVVEALVGLLSHETVEVVKRAVSILCGMKARQPDLVDALVGLLKHEDHDVVKRAAQALGEMGEAVSSRPGVMKALVDLLSDEDSLVASRTSRILAQIGESTASRAGVVKALLEVSSSGDEWWLLHRLSVASTTLDRLPLE